MTDGDKLDLHDLLNPSSTLSFGEEGGKAVLSVSTDGIDVDQVVVFDNWTLADLQAEFGASDAADLITKMHANGNLITD